MTTRFNSRSVTNYDIPGLETAMDGPSSTLTIPSCGIEDVDLSLFNLFDKEIPFQVTTDDGIKPVPVIFAAGEKWALNKRKRAIRDKMNTLILPLITIVRTEISQDPTIDIAGRGTGRHQRLIARGTLIGRSVNISLCFCRVSDTQARRFLGK